jgi:hypothetical protein
MMMNEPHVQAIVRSLFRKLQFLAYNLCNNSEMNKSSLIREFSNKHATPHYAWACLSRLRLELAYILAAFGIFLKKKTLMLRWLRITATAGLSLIFTDKQP